MASDRIYQLFDQIESQSETYAHSASRLSDYIKYFEKRLESLPGKVGIGVEIEGGLTLEFRRDGSGWGLLYRSPVEPRWSRLSGASVAIKSKCARAFEGLLENILVKQIERSEEANRALDTIESLLGDIPLGEKEIPDAGF